ncbi:MAG: queuosine precursor transporter [Treponema sp.]|nr:queuosine precursor transporter [Treponema sp.]
MENISQESKQGRYRDLVTALFVVVIVASNIASSAKVVDLRFSILGIDLIFDGGTLLFPFAYIIGALITEVYGFRVMRRTIWIGFICLGIAALSLFILGLLPGEELWESYAGQEAYDAILGGMSTGGIVLASLSAYLFGKFFDSIIHSRLKVLTKGRLLWFRALGSSVIGQLLDSFIFISIATLAGIFPGELFFALVFTNCLLKVLIEVIATPLTYLSVSFLKKAEGLDVYDRDIKYNPFKF